MAEGTTLDLSAEVTDLSVSRTRTLDKCQLAYDYQYVQRIPAPYDKARTLFGTVVHNGVEEWYGPPGSNRHMETELKDFIHAQWFTLLPKDVCIDLRKTIEAAAELDSLAELIKITRPKIKSPRQTKDFEISAENKRFQDMRDQLLATCAKAETVKWPKNENAFQAYTKSMEIAVQLQSRWRRFPRPVVVEASFNIEFAGLQIRGRIDQVRADPDPMGQTLIDLTDIKTGTQPLTQMEAFLQAFIYDRACLLDPMLPVPDIITYWLARHNKPQHGKIDRDRHEKLATRILHSVKRRIEAQDATPSYGMWCKSCDFFDLCSAEINLWPPGTDGLTLEVEVV